MLNHAEIIARLETAFDQETLRSTVERLRSVPEVWLALQDSAFLESLLEHPGDVTWTPGSIATSALIYHQPKKLDFEGEDETAKSIEKPATQLFKLAQEAHGFAKSAESSLEETLEPILAEPLASASLLCCAWPQISNAGEVLDRILAAPTREIVRLIGCLRRANSTDPIVEQKIQEHAHKLAPFLFEMASTGEEALAQIIAKTLSGSPEDDSPVPSTPETQYQAYARALTSDYGVAQQLLGTAWDASIEATAGIADLLAEVARSENNPAVELEARRQAAEKSATPRRRAELARVLIQQAKHYEAAQLVAHPGSIEERIAHGSVALMSGQVDLGSDLLIGAKDEAIHLEYKQVHWLRSLADALLAAGLITETIEVELYMARIFPHHADYELRAAKLLHDSGDSVRAADHAYLAHVLSPTSVTAKKQLALSLQASGKPGEALHFYEQVVEHDRSVLEDFGRCALENHDSDLATQIAERLLEHEPDSVPAQMLLARSYLVQGQIGKARSAVDSAFLPDSNQPAPWLLLAEIHTAAADHTAAGEALLKAIQVAPADGTAHRARARWLRHQDRIHEAVEHSAISIELEPHITAWLVEHAELLTNAGEPRESRPLLEKALGQQPNNWAVRLMLARIQESDGELDSAASLVQDYPTGLEETAIFDTGRILIKAGLHSNPDTLRKGLTLLDTLSPDSDGGYDQHFWSARAHEQLGSHDQAIQHYDEFLSQTNLHIHPNALEAVLGYARVSIELGNADQASAFLESVREEYPASMDVLDLLARAYVTSGEEKQAFTIALEAVKLNPLSLESHMLLSQTAEAIGDVRTAIDAEQKVLSQQPSNVESLKRLARLFNSVKDVPAARSHMAKAVSMSRRDPQSLHVLADLCEECGWQDTGLRLLSLAGNLAPHDLSLQQSLADLAERQGAYDVAKQAWLRCIDHTPDDPAFLDRAAHGIAKSGDNASAILLWEKAILINTEDQSLRFALANAYHEQGDPRSALDQYTQLLELHPTDPDILATIARHFIHYGDPGKGRHLVQRTAAQHPKHAGIRIVQIEDLLQAGEADRALELALSSNSPDAHTLALAALSAVMTGDIPRASAGLDEALREPHLPTPALEVLHKVSMALGEWNTQRSVLAALVKAAMGSTRNRQIACTALLRARDVELLYAKAFQVRSNKPDPDSIQKQLNMLMDCSEISNAENRCHLSAHEQWRDLVDSPSAEVELKAVQLSASERQELLQGAAISLIIANRPAQALKLLDQHSPTGPYRGFHALLTGLASLNLDQYSRAKDSAEMAARAMGSRACGEFLKAMIARQETELDTAASMINAALAVWPDESTWHAELAEIYLHSDRHDVALPHLQQAVELAPDEPDILLSLARTYRSSGELAQAEATYARCLQAVPGTAQIWKEAGEVALVNGNAVLAERWFERACSLAPSDAVCLMGSARSALLNGEVKLAAERAQGAYKLAPNEPQVLTGFAEILTTQGKTEKAIQAYDRALKISAGDPHILLARSRVLMQDGQYVDAVTDIKSALDQQPGDAGAWALLAEAYEGSDQLSEALSAINHALEHAPLTGAYRLARGRIYRKTGQLDQALDVLRQLDMDHPDNPDLPGELGQVYEARREADSALEAYLRAVAKNPRDISSCMRAGVILKNLKSYGSAANMFEQVVKARPNDAKALHQLAAVRALQLVHGGMETQAVTQ